jgi:hypothetical protein
VRPRDPALHGTTQADHLIAILDGPRKPSAERAQLTRRTLRRRASSIASSTESKLSATR